MSTFTLEILKFSQLSEEETLRALEKNVGLTPERAEEVVRAVPAKLQSGLEKSKAQELTKKLQSIGARVRIIQDATGKSQVFNPTPQSSATLAAAAKPAPQPKVATPSAARHSATTQQSPSTSSTQPPATTQKRPPTTPANKKTPVSYDEKQLRKLLEERMFRMDHAIWKGAIAFVAFIFLGYLGSFFFSFLSGSTKNFFLIPYILLIAFLFIRYLRWLKGDIVNKGKLIKIEVDHISEMTRLLLKAFGLGSNILHDFLGRHFPVRTQHFSFHWEGKKIEGGQALWLGEEVIKDEDGNAYLFVNPSRPKLSHLLATKVKD